MYSWQTLRTGESKMMSVARPTTWWDALQSSWIYLAKCMNTRSLRLQAWFWEWIRCSQVQYVFFVKVLWHKICDSRVPCQLCASKTWMVTTTSPVQNLMVPKASGKKCRLLGYNYKWSWLQHVFKPCQISFNFSQLYSVLKMVSICVVQSFLTDIIVFSKWF